MTLLRLGLVKVGAELVRGDGGRGWGHQERVGALWLRPKAPVAGAGALGGSFRQHDPQPVLVAQGHTLQEVVQQLRGHRLVKSRTAGHKRVHVVHTLDVASRKTLAGLPGY